MRFPLKDKIKVGYSFGERTWYNNFHLGQDYRALNGKPLYAPDRGQIIWQGWGKQGGNTIHFKDSKGNVWRFMHLLNFSANYIGKVKEGRLLGHCDNTGLSSGSHLHIDISKGFVQLNNRSNFIDPERYIKIKKGDDEMKREDFGYTIGFKNKKNVFALIKKPEVFLEEFKGKVTYRLTHPTDLQDKIVKLKAQVKSQNSKIDKLEQSVGEWSDKLVDISNKLENCKKAKTNIDKFTAWELLKAIGRKFKNILEKE